MSISASSSLFWLLLLLAISIIITWYFYRKNDWLNSQKPWVIWGIPLLRGTGIFLLLTLLLEITLLINHTEVEEPILITVLDNSSSLLQYKDSNETKRTMNKLIQDVKDRFDGTYQLAFYTAGKSFKENGILSLNEQESNHAEAFTYISEQYLNRNIGAILFASDGNYNVGDNPTYPAEKINLTPIFTLGIGDTTPKKDQIITNLYYNDVVFLRDEFPIEVDLEAFKIKQKQVKVTLTQQGKLLGSQVVNYTNQEYTFKQVRFDVTASKVGFQPFTVSVEYLSGEFSKVNNSKTCYIEVVDSRNNVCFISNGVHPDLAALRAVASSNENYQSSFLSPKELVEKGLKPDLVVWHNPTLQFDPNISAYIEQHRIPVFYVVSPSATNQDLSKLKIFASTNGRNQSDEVQGSLNPGFSAFELSDECQQSIPYYPPLVTKFGAMNPLGNTEALLNQRVGNAVKKEPLLYFGKTKQNVPYGVIYGEGVWRWKLNEFMKYQHYDYFTELFSKSFNYLMVKRSGMGLSVQFDKRFGKYDRIGVNANFYNASLEPITKPTINLTLTGPQGKKYTNRFNVSGNHYSLDLGTLPSGTYKWTASTTHEKKKYSKSGVFVVEDIGLEQATNTANHGVLKQLSKNSGGSFSALKDYEKLLKQIEGRADITTIERLTIDFWNLVDSWVFMLLIALIFSSEWFLKRYFGAY
jgi:hypothetical protein